MSEVVEDFLDRHAYEIDEVLTHFPGERHLAYDSLLLIQLLAGQRRFMAQNHRQMTNAEFSAVYDEYCAKLDACTVAMIPLQPVSADRICIHLKRATLPPCK